MKRKKTPKQMMAEVTYQKQAMGKKVTTIQKSFKEVMGILNEKK